VVEHGWLRDRFLVSSFLRRELRKFRKVDVAETPTGLLLARPTSLTIPIARAFGCTAVHPALGHTKAQFVDKAHQNGLKVFVYTVNEPGQIEAMRQIGIDGVFTDFPDRVQTSGRQRSA
jgi:glycerophosphoryl diester phosphodiesterase